MLQPYRGMALSTKTGFWLPGTPQFTDTTPSARVRDAKAEATDGNLYPSLCRRRTHHEGY